MEQGQSACTFPATCLFTMPAWNSKFLLGNWSVFPYNTWISLAATGALSAILSPNKERLIVVAYFK